MMRKTRNFVIASLVVLTAGVGTGLVAYYGFPTAAFMATAAGPAELKYLPGTTTLVAFADVHQVMTSELRQKLRDAMPFTGDGQQSFQSQTGINIETDLDRIVFGLAPASGSGDPADLSGLVLARGRFDVVKLEALLREKGATVQAYKGRNLYSPTNTMAPSAPRAPEAPAPGTPAAPVAPRAARGETPALTFLEPGLVAVGTPGLLRRAIDLKDGGDSVTTNEGIMSRVRELESGNVWAVGRFDALTSRANLGQGMMGQLPAITWFSASGQVDSGVRASLKAETRDEQSATALRDLVRGFFALAKLQAGSRPELQGLLETLQLGGTGQNVTLALDLSPQTLDLLTNSMRQMPRPNRPSR